MGEKQDRFDVRIALGAFFLLTGLTLAAFGAVGPLRESLPLSGASLDLAWGTVLAVFGALLLLAARFGRRGRH